jgi:hypothetical protein
MNSAFIGVEEIVKKPVSYDQSEAIQWVNESMQRTQKLSETFDREVRSAGHWKNGGAIPIWVAVLVIGLVLLGWSLAFIGV